MNDVNGENIVPNEYQNKLLKKSNIIKTILANTDVLNAIINATETPIPKKKLSDNTFNTLEKIIALVLVLSIVIPPVSSGGLAPPTNDPCNPLIIESPIKRLTGSELALNTVNTNKYTNVSTKGSRTNQRYPNFVDPATFSHCFLVINFDLIISSFSALDLSLGKSLQLSELIIRIL